MKWIPLDIDQDSLQLSLQKIFNQEDYFVHLDNCNYSEGVIPSKVETIYAWGVKKEFVAEEYDEVDEVLKELWDHKEWRFGYFSYDLKNSFERLESNNPVYTSNALVDYFEPEYVLKQEYGRFYANTQNTIDKIKGVSMANTHQSNSSCKLKLIIDKGDYVAQVDKLKKHIQRGDIFEVNYCMPIQAKFDQIDFWELHRKLRKASPTPFFSLIKTPRITVVAASPERYMTKIGTTLYSQPIKGTSKRESSFKEDQVSKESLIKSEKEQTENVMIVDLVRNDLSKIAKRHSVEINELFGIYSFPQVHQMISTVSCQVDEQKTLYDILKATFPMGSMTGAPKIEAMQLIEEYEVFKRGIYSGTIGYINPSNDFDFNVVIRSIISGEKNTIVFPVGSAITHLAKADQEYDECLLKAKAIIDIINE